MAAKSKVPSAEDRARGAKIKRARERLRLDAIDVAKKVKVTRSSIWNWENGKTSPLGWRRHRLAELLHLDENWDPVELQTPLDDSGLGEVANPYGAMSNRDLVDHLSLLTDELGRRLVGTEVHYVDGGHPTWVAPDAERSRREQFQKRVDDETA